MQQTNQTILTPSRDSSGAVLAALKAAFPQTIPVLTGYFVLGLGYGIYVQSLGLPIWLPPLIPDDFRRLLVLGREDQERQKPGEHGGCRAGGNGDAKLDSAHGATSSVLSACSMGLRSTSSSTRMQIMDGIRKLPEPNTSRKTNGTTSPMKPE